MILFKKELKTCTTKGRVFRSDTDITFAEVQTSKTFEMVMVIILIFEGLSYFTVKDDNGLHVECRDNLQGKGRHKSLCFFTVERSGENPILLIY